MALLLADIRSYVTAKQVNRPFYLIGNNPQSLEQAAPGSLSGLDGIFSEAITYRQSPADGSVSIPFPGAVYATGVLAGFYKDRTVFSNDYPPLADPDAVLKSFELGIGLSWIPSVTTALQTPQILSTGPVMFAANKANGTVLGVIDRVNYIAGGTSADATLIGGNAGDYLIGGPGQNTIIGGAGDDMIFAHPPNVRNQLVIMLIADVKNSTNPSVEVLVNGQIALAPALVTATFDNNQVQELTIDTTPFGTVLSIEIDGIVAPYLDPTHYANIQLQSLKFQGQSLLFNQAQYNSGSGALNGGARAIINSGGKITFSSPTLPIAPPAPRDTRDLIDGGSGVNTVVYRAAANNYSVMMQTDGSVLVTSANTNEGPDILRNVQFLQFLDRKVSLIDAIADSKLVTEFYHPAFDHYFITAVADEAANLAAGKLPPWVPTGKSFKVWTATGTTTNVWRFFSAAFAPKSGHFYTNNPTEAASLQAGGVWTLEDPNAFYMIASPSGTCPSGTIPLYRLYNNGQGGAPNHRYTVDPATRSSMIAAQWIPEGNGPNGVFACVLP